MRTWCLLPGRARPTGLGPLSGPSCLHAVCVVLGAQPGQSPAAPLDQLGIAVGGAKADAAHRIQDSVDDQACLLGAGQRPAVSGEERAVQAGAAGPGIGQTDQVPYGGSGLAALEVDHRDEVVRLVAVVCVGVEDVAELEVSVSLHPLQRWQ